MSAPDDRDGVITAEHPILTAERLIEQGRLAEAAEICEGLCREDPEHAEALYLLGLIRVRQDRLSEAYELMRRAVERFPNARHLRHDLASLSARFGRVAEAEAHLRVLQQQTPTDPAIHLHLGLIQRGSGDTEAAAASFRAAIDLDPGYVGAHQALGSLFYRAGRLEEALPHLRRVRNAERAGADPFVTLATTLLALGRDEELLALDSQGATTAGQLLSEAAIKAVAAWHADDVEACRAQLEGAAPFVHVPAQAWNRHAFVACIDCLRRLLEFRRLNPAAYAGEVDGEIHVVGDSQALAMGHLRIAVGGRPHRVVPRALPGARAYSLAREESAHVRGALEATLQRIPEGGAMIAAFGSLDLQFGMGIMSAVRKEPDADPDDLVDDLVARYVETLVEAAQARRLSLAVMSPPASALRLRGRPAEDVALFQRIAERFHERLRQTAAAAGCTYLDLYRATLGDGGRADGRYLLDDRHVWPPVLLEVAEAAGL